MTNQGPNVVPVGFTVLYQNMCFSFYSLDLSHFLGGRGVSMDGGLMLPMW